MAQPLARRALLGSISAGVALGLSELTAGVVRGLPSLVEGLGNWVIDTVPESVERWAISIFGTADKLVLLVGITLVTLVLGAATGVVSERRDWLPPWVFTGFAGLATLAAGRDPATSLGVAVIPAALSALGGLAVFRFLERGAGTHQAPGRRAFLASASAMLGLAVLSGGVGRYLIQAGRRVAAGRFDVVLPGAAVALPPVADDAELGIPGLSPVITPNETFYRIDTAFAVPRVDLQDWQLTVDGRVDRPYSLSYFDLLEMRLVEKDITLSCVSNPVGGDLVGTARWLGVPLREVLERAGVAADAEQLVGRSVDGFTVGFPVEAVFDGRDALVAVGMNGEPLPFEHGFPARLVVAGLYGYVSATKWLSRIELTGWDEFDAYWVPRGWAKEAPIKTQSRIDTPRDGQSLGAGSRLVAGVAWAPVRGIARVEVQLGEGGPWEEAILSEPLSASCWRQWAIEWNAEPGTHLLRVRATDGSGAVQTEEIRPPAPDGATGWHTIRVVVG